MCSNSTACIVNAAIAVLARIGFLQVCLHASIDLAEFGYVVGEKVLLC
jgi:hypothetical protein